MLTVPPGSALAHGGGARLLVTPDRVHPGGSVEVRGEDLPADGEVVLSIAAGTASPLDLASAEADGAGHFTAALAIPTDLAPGDYRLLATVAGAPALSATVVVEGAPIEPAGEPGPRTRTTCC